MSGETRRQLWPSLPELRSELYRRGKTRLQRVVLPVVTFSLIVIAWQAIVISYEIPTIVLPSPLEVGAAFLSNWRFLIADGIVTATTAGLGLLASIVVGLALAFAMIQSRSVTAILLPYVIALRVAPMIAIAPLLFLWVGRGIPAKALLVTTLTVFPVTVATLDGLRSTPESYLLLMQSVGASSLETFLHVRLPAAAPSVFAGVETAATLSVVGAVVAEFVTLDAGLGTRVFVTSNSLQTADAFATVMALTLLGVGFYIVPVAIERHVDGRA